MKNLLIILALFTLGLSKTFSQPLTFEQQNFGISIGTPAMNDYNYSSRNPSLSAHYEYGISDKIGIGYIGVGGLISIAGAEYNKVFQSASVSYDHSQTLIGPRAFYHFDMVDLTGSKDWSNIDVYGGAFLGLKFETAKYTEPITDTKHKEKNTKLATDLFAGIRYGFNDNIGTFAELGFGVL